jgi:CO dehydrogenase maturation factor
MKLAVSGKGGVGKTTFASLMIRTLNAEGKRVLAIDADPDANLAAGLGIADSDKIVPIAEMEDLIFERTGAKPGSIGGYFKLNPKVDDLPDAVSVGFEGIKLMRLGGIKKADPAVSAPKVPCSGPWSCTSCWLAMKWWSWIWRPASSTWAGQRQRPLTN